MDTNESIKLVALKSLIIPKLPNDFHKSLFFKEIEYQKNPSKKLRHQLINLYIQGIDYYNIQDKKDLSLYFQTKLLTLMKGGVDYFEKLIEQKFEENKNEINNYIEKESHKCIEQVKKFNDNMDKVVNAHLKEQENQFITNLRKKRKLVKYKRINSVDLELKPIIINLRWKSKKIEDLQIVKRISENFSLKEKEKNTNSIFLKIDNALNNLDRINALLIIEYTKKLKQHMKKEIQKMDETIKKYNEYNLRKNKFNLMYDSIKDTNEKEAKNLQEQINSVNKEWDEFNKKTSKSDDKYKEIIKFDKNNLDDLIDNLNKNIKEIKEIKLDIK